MIMISQLRPRFWASFCSAMLILSACRDGPTATMPDVTAPTVVVSSPQRDTVLNAGAIQLSGTASDSVGVVRVTYRANDGAEQALSAARGPRVEFSGVVPLTDGTNMIVVYAYDAAGNRGTAGGALRIVRDGDPPRISVTIPADTAPTVRVDTVRITGTLRDAGGVARAAYTVNGGAETPIVIALDTSVAFSFVAALPATGANTIEVLAYDRAGNGARFRARPTYVPARYTISTLPPLAGNVDSFAYDINDDGVVVGTSGVHAVQWVSLRPENLAQDAASATASAINANGAIVGQASGVAFRTASDGFTRLTAPADANFNTASGINRMGQVAGTSWYPDAMARAGSAVVWDADGSPRLIHGMRSFNPTVGTDINDVGQVTGAGRAQGSLYDAPFVTERDTARVLPTPGFPGGYAQAINSRGLVVGLVREHGGEHSRPARWENGVFSLLTQVVPAGFSVYGSASDVSDAGLVVGSMQLERGPGILNRAVLWESGRPTDLNAEVPPGSGWVLWFASAINSRGQIVGWGSLDGRTQAFLLTPR